MILSTKNSNDFIEKGAMEEERRKYVDYINSISLKHLIQIKPLFFRQAISTAESHKLWLKLVETWGVDKPHGVMYPITSYNPKNAMFLEKDYFNKQEGVEYLRAILTGRGINRVWELRETGDPEYEIDVSAFEPYYNGAEGYWLTTELDWIIYASHEGTITFNGWIKEAVREVLESQKLNEKQIE